MNSARQTHCLLDCLSYALQSGDSFEYRPLYFGVWNAPFAVTDEGISYYSQNIGIDELVTRFEQLYGQSLSRLLDYRKTKSDNFALLEEQMTVKDKHRYILILIDLYELPYSNQCYKTKHRPHIVISDHWTGNECYLIDPFFEWEGYVSRDVLRQAFYCENLGLALAFDKKGMREPDTATISTIFAADYSFSPSKLITQVEIFVRNVIAEEESCSLDTLYRSIEQSGVIAKRWNGYEMAFAYFSEALDVDPYDAIAKVQELKKKWESIVLSIVRANIAGKRDVLYSLKDKLDQVGALETSIKLQLWDIYEQWDGACHAYRLHRRSIQAAE